MPGWHAGTERLREAGKIAMIGIVQEQHAERARLFLQWQRMDWPVMVDALNLLDFGVVPVTLLIDEHGVIRERARGRDAAALVEAFLARPFDAPETLPARGARPDLDRLRRPAADDSSAGAWRGYAEALVLWGGEERLDEAIEAFRRALTLEGDDARAEFRLGVAYRMRYDAGGGAEDFTRAVEHWTRAGELDPNNYIWARRLQQYGPRQQKPYPFYDWVDQARREIRARGETPAELTVEPRGAELALPAVRFAERRDPGMGLDPNGKVRHDERGLVRATATLVPPEILPSRTARVYLEFRPSADLDAHWNNEVRGLVVWLDAPEGWSIDRNQTEVRPPAQPVSEEPRRVEYEVRSPADAAGPARLSGYALYYVCEGVDGQCLYRRQDLRVEVAVRR